MKNILANLTYLLHNANITHGIYSGCIALIIILLTIFHKYCKNDKKKILIWRICGIIPFIIIIIHFCIYCLAGKCTNILFSNYTTLYIPAILTLIWGLLANRKTLFKITTIIINVIAIACFIYTTLTSIYISNFVNMSYTDSFKSLLNEMKEKYVLNEWKEIDYNAIESELLPTVQEAEKNNDKISYAIALMKYAYYFYDGHIGVAFDKELEDKIYEKVAGNDFGFSMITTDDNKTIAILVDENSEAYKSGIINGTQILKWNGLNIDTAIENVQCYAYGGIPVKENEDFLRPIYLAGDKNSEIEITFINAENKEETIRLKSIGFYKERLDMVHEKLFKKDTNVENFYTKMLNEDCGYLKITKESYNIYDEIAYVTDNHFLLKNFLIEKIDDLKSKGMKNLIIDLRNNGGGLEIISREVASLFANQEYFSSAIGYVKDKKYINISNQYVNANGKYSDINVAVLVNMKCISAGDSLVDYLRKLPNVTIFGITEPNGSNQVVGGLGFVSEGIAAISYPIGLSLDENNEPYIDTNIEKVSRNPVEYKIPFSYEAAMAIFNEDRDYELEYVMQYINQNL